MQIKWFGQFCFLISAVQSKGNPAQIVIDLFSAAAGFKLPKTEADIVLVSHKDPACNNAEGVGGEKFVIEGPGEYEVKGVYIEGIPSWRDDSRGKERGQNTIYVIEAEDLRICHLGGIGQAELTEDQLEKIGEIDILLAPIGGQETIAAKEAIKMVSQIEPKITIPMHYQIPKLKMKLDGLEPFLKSLGIKSLAPEPKLTVKKKDLSPEEAKIVVLEP